jgi:uncharacterized protein YprB with RNaseH-like and TPR domain
MYSPNHMSKEIIFDIETIGDIRNFLTMKVTCVSIYEFEHDRYRSFDEHELAQLWPILEQAERLIGYNSLHFDLPILQNNYPGDLSRIAHLDILKAIKESTGSRFKLNDIAKATLQIEGYLMNGGLILRRMCTVTRPSVMADIIKTYEFKPSRLK